MPAQLLV